RGVRSAIVTAGVSLGLDNASGGAAVNEHLAKEIAGDFDGVAGVERTRQDRAEKLHLRTMVGETKEMRLFTALDLPGEVLSNLEEVLRRLKPTAQIQWTLVQNLHITIKFVGELADSRVGELTRALAGVPRRGTIPVRVRQV